MDQLTLYPSQDSLIQLNVSLLEKGVSNDAALQLLSVYKKCALQIAEQYCSHPQLLNNPSRQVLYFAYLKDRYMKLLSKWRDDLLKAVAVKYSGQSNQGAPRQRNEFNKKFIPKLESYYNTNKFPSRAEKMCFARESGMNYKQIDVWFQNRRNRSLRGSKAAACPRSEHKCATENVSMVSGVSNKSYTQMPPVSIYSTNTAFPPCPPFPYTFPVDYPLAPGFDARPYQMSNRPLETNWYRKPAIQAVKYLVPNISLLCRAMEKLSITDESTASTEEWSGDKINPAIIRPYPSPLPFLVRAAKKSQHSDLTTKFRCKPQQRCASQRKVLQLPKRLPSTLRRKNDHCISGSYFVSRSSSPESLPTLSRCSSESSSLDFSDNDDPISSPLQLPKNVTNLFSKPKSFTLPDYPLESSPVLPDDLNILRYDSSYAFPQLHSSKEIRVIS